MQTGVCCGQSRLELLLETPSMTPWPELRSLLETPSSRTQRPAMSWQLRSLDTLWLRHQPLRAPKPKISAPCSYWQA